MYSEYINNNAYGYAGGVIDQPDEYWQDMATMWWLSKWHKHVKPVAGMVDQTSWLSNIKAGKPIGKVNKHGNN